VKEEDRLARCYLLAVLLPPLAVLRCGHRGLVAVNVMLTLLGWVPGAVHAVLVVHEHEADRRVERMLRSLAKSE